MHSSDKLLQIIIICDRRQTHLVNDVEFLFRFIELERRVGTDEVDFIVKIYFNNVTIPTRFEPEIINNNIAFISDIISSLNNGPFLKCKRPTS